MGLTGGHDAGAPGNVLFAILPERDDLIRPFGKAEAGELALDDAEHEHRRQDFEYCVERDVI